MESEDVEVFVEPGTTFWLWVELDESTIYKSGV